MVRYAALLLAALLVGCSQSPSPKEPGPGSSRLKNRLTAGTDKKSDSDRKSDRQTKKDSGSKPAGDSNGERTGPPTEAEVKAAARTFLERSPDFAVADVQVTFVSPPLDVPEKKKQAVASPSLRDVRAYYIGFTAINLALNEKLSSRNYLVLAGREPAGVKVLACYKDDEKRIAAQMGQDWLKKNPPPQK